ncbi:helix-turn-helix domain-containing protein [Aeromicrobium sp. UC242_57]|uniref:helix-turn-helix domain-containing protein n=1 Tax=Aeromicrobium sp. UC242_57 TaxID=3374624 RepID=UPI0037955724
MRQQRGLSLRQLAAGLDVSAGTVSAIENGHTSVTVDRLAAIAAILDVSAGALLVPGGLPYDTTSADAGAGGRSSRCRSTRCRPAPSRPSSRPATTAPP